MIKKFTTHIYECCNSKLSYTYIYQNGLAVGCKCGKTQLILFRRMRTEY